MTREEKQRQFSQKIDKARQAEIKESLPHLYGWKWYAWAHEFFKSTAKTSVLTAPNQVSKSSTQIRKCIHWATDKRLWPKLWQTTPRTFWYLYPDKKFATMEFEQKWTHEFLPRGKFKDDPIFGWKEYYDKDLIDSILFKSGVTVYFRTYSQNPESLQGGTVWALFTDEELPEDLFGELVQRTSAVDGYSHFVFTATKSQDFWYRVMEKRGTDEEELREAFKIQISKYDCLFYEDGTPSQWTVEKIKAEEKVLSKNKNDVLRRIYGRVVPETSSLKYHAYDPSKHFIKPRKFDATWRLYSGVDIGAGGGVNHPAAIIFVAVRPDFRLGYVFRGWRGDHDVTAAADVFAKYVQLAAGLAMTMEQYDWHSKEFGIIAQRAGRPFVSAEKSHDRDVLNDLFMYEMLYIFQDEAGELVKLSTELVRLRKTTAKTKASDDFCDSLRYAVGKIPWDWSMLVGNDPDPIPVFKEKPQKQLSDRELVAMKVALRTENRRKGVKHVEDDEGEKWTDREEIAFWNDLAGT